VCQRPLRCVYRPVDLRTWQMTCIRSYMWLQCGPSARTETIQVSKWRCLHWMTCGCGLRQGMEVDRHVLLEPATTGNHPGQMMRPGSEMLLAVAMLLLLLLLLLLLGPGSCSFLAMPGGARNMEHFTNWTILCPMLWFTDGAVQEGPGLPGAC
jgi:hypothetical protein